MRPPFLVFGGLYLLGLIVRDAYELLKKAGRLDTRDPRVFAAVFGAMCALWVGWFGMGLTDTTRVHVPDALAWAGFALVGTGLVLAIWGIAQLRGLENIDRLVTTGVYARIRHPMYVGFILWILGWSLALGSVSSLAVGPLGLLSIAWWRHLEERALESHYGEAYAQYRAATWF